MIVLTFVSDAALTVYHVTVIFYVLLVLILTLFLLKHLDVNVTLVGFMIVFIKLNNAVKFSFIKRRV